LTPNTIGILEALILIGSDKVYNVDVKKPVIVEKPWGREVHYAVEPEYVGKILEVKKGCRLSLQYHKRKKETMYILDGKVELTLGEDTLELSEGASVTIEPGEIHRVYAVTDARILEASTNHLDDVVRVKDDYRR
jgi:mannose-6-phosphate isomerase